MKMLVVQLLFLCGVIRTVTGYECTFFQDKCMPDCMGAESSNFEFENDGDGFIYVIQTALGELSNNTWTNVGRCLEHCNATSANSISLPTDYDIHTALYRGYTVMPTFLKTDPMTQEDSPYDLNDHSATGCKGNILWEYNVFIDSQCHNTGSPGGKSGKIWNHDQGTTWNVQTWHHHDCRSGQVEKIAVGNRAKGYCTKNGLLSWR